MKANTVMNAIMNEATATLEDSTAIAGAQQRLASIRRPMKSPGELPPLRHNVGPQRIPVAGAQQRLASIRRPMKSPGELPPLRHNVGPQRTPVVVAAQSAEQSDSLAKPLTNADRRMKY
jgi:hypothetical protein